MVFQKIEKGRPVYTLVAPPVASAGIFIITKVGMEFSEEFPHLAGIFHGNRPVVVTMINIDSGSTIIAGKFEDITAIAGPVKVLFVDILPGHGNLPVGRGISQQGRIAGTGGNGCPLPGVGCSQVPGTMSSHRMTCQVNPVGGRLQSVKGNSQHLHRIHASPVLPVESPGTPVCWGNQVTLFFRLVCAGLTDGFHSGTMDRQIKRPARYGASLAGIHSKILQTSVDVAEKCAFIGLMGGNGRNCQGRFRDPFPLLQQGEKAFDLPGSVNSGPVESEHHLPDGEGRDIRNPSCYLLSGNFCAKGMIPEGKRGTVHHHDGSHQRLVGLPFHNVGQRGIFDLQHDRGDRENNPGRDTRRERSCADVYFIDPFF